MVPPNNLSGVLWSTTFSDIQRGQMDYLIIMYTIAFCITQLDFFPFSIALKKGRHCRISGNHSILIKSFIYWDTTPGRLFKMNRRFTGKCHLHLTDRSISQQEISNKKQ
jgi:hypothetical protein